MLSNKYKIKIGLQMADARSNMDLTHPFISVLLGMDLREKCKEIINESFKDDVKYHNMHCIGEDRINNYFDYFNEKIRITNIDNPFPPSIYNCLFLTISNIPPYFNESEIKEDVEKIFTKLFSFYDPNIKFLFIFDYTGNIFGDDEVSNTISMTYSVYFYFEAHSITASQLKQETLVLAKKRIWDLDNDELLQVPCSTISRKEEIINNRVNRTSKSLCGDMRKEINMDGALAEMHFFRNDDDVTYPPLFMFFEQIKNTIFPKVLKQTGLKKKYEFINSSGKSKVAKINNNLALI